MARVLEESAEHVRIDITMSQILNCLSDQQAVKCGFVPSNQILRLNSGGNKVYCIEKCFVRKQMDCGKICVVRAILAMARMARTARTGNLGLLTEELEELVDSANRQELFGLFIKKPGQVVPPKAWTHGRCMQLCSYAAMHLVTDFEGTAWCGASTTKDATTTTFVVRVPKAFFCVVNFNA